MRTSRVACIAATCVLGVVVWAAGCADWLDLSSDCVFTLKCCPDGTLRCLHGSGGHDGGTGTGGSGGQMNCDPAMGAVDGGCGVFVSSSKGSDSNDGSQEKPLATIGSALMKAGAGRVYACGENFKEAVTVSAGVTLYGALDCAKGWAYDASKKTLVTTDSGVPLTLTATANGAEIDDFKFVAPDVAMQPGASSIAVVADHATAAFTRCDLLAQGAGDGEAGVSGGVQAMQAGPGVKGDDAGTMGTLGGGSAGSNPTCSLQGGNGGNGGVIGGGDGQDGQSGDNGNGGAKGTGDTGVGCTAGIQGGNGMSGPAGLVTPGIGTIDKSGYHGIDGQAGGDGTNGTSGGGGGGSIAKATAHGAGGGGGGAGGCAGKLGTGGTAAGSSIALVSLGASVTLASCTLAAGKAGSGGDGGDGQFGQPGGDLGPPGKAGAGAAAGCAGGAGGSGGNGGNGSGGLGGHSLGIAATGTAPMLDDGTKKATTPGTKGSGGLGGNMDASMNHGADGMAAACWDFGSNAACN